MTDTELPQRVLSRPAVIVTAHPDDETIGLGTLLNRFRRLRAIIDVTDGAPRRGRNAAKAGVHSWQEYAALRHRELICAMQRAELRTTQLVCLGYPDQETTFHIDEITRRLTKLFRRFHARAVFTHPYEGGHPDHDACAAAVRYTCRFLPREIRPAIYEFASYHSTSSQVFQAEAFLGRSRKFWTRLLTDEQRQFKRHLLASFASQTDVIQEFPLHAEPIRLAPDYDFRKPPHHGKPHYENFDWGVTGPRWRRFASQAEAKLATL